VVDGLPSFPGSTQPRDRSTRLGAPALGPRDYQPAALQQHCEPIQVGQEVQIRAVVGVDVDLVVVGRELVLQTVRVELAVQLLVLSREGVCAPSRRIAKLWVEDADLRQAVHLHDQPVVSAVVESQPASVPDCSGACASWAPRWTTSPVWLLHSCRAYR
jgi:hypothetical protein